MNVWSELFVIASRIVLADPAFYVVTALLLAITIIVLFFLGLHP